MHGVIMKVCSLVESEVVDMRLGALEAGGTKMVCAIGDEIGNIFEQILFPTTTPEETIPRILSYFTDHRIEALGIGAFGPVDLNRNSHTYGYILNTPKLAWKQYDLLGNMKRVLNIPIGIDTDVNCACLGEMTYGQAKGLDCVIYLTIGTGIGAGISVGGKLLHGMLHPEAGHVMIKRHVKDAFTGSCPYHMDCFEGLASGTAIKLRYGKKASELNDQKEVWELEAYYIAQALTNYILTLSPKKIILGGGVMSQLQLFPLIRKEVMLAIAGYINTKQLQDIETYIVPASLNGSQGILGAFELARNEVFVN
jgi:fructokinase